MIWRLALGIALTVILVFGLAHYARADDLPPVPACDDLPRNSWCGAGSAMLCQNRNGVPMYVATCTVDIMNSYCRRYMTIEQCLQILQDRVNRVEPVKPN